MNDVNLELLVLIHDPPFGVDAGELQVGSLRRDTFQYPPGLREYDVGFASHPDACSELAEMVHDERAAFVRREPESIGGNAVPHLLERGVRDELFRDGVAVIQGLALPLESQRCQDECWRKENRDRKEDDDDATP